ILASFSKPSTNSAMILKICQESFTLISCQFLLANEFLILFSPVIRVLKVIKSLQDSKFIAVAREEGCVLQKVFTRKRQSALDNLSPIRVTYLLSRTNNIADQLFEFFDLGQSAFCLAIEYCDAIYADMVSATR